MDNNLKKTISIRITEKQYEWLKKTNYSYLIRAFIDRLMRKKRG